jgi:hypothetical protein
VPRPPRLPPDERRDSATFWRRMVDASQKRRAVQNEQFARFARWHRGDMRDVERAEKDQGEPRWQSGLENMTHAATVASLADLFFRWPRFVVRPSAAAHHLYPPPLAALETQFLAHTLRQVGYRRKARRAIQDALLGGLGVLKLVADPEVVVDEDARDAARAEAAEELRLFLVRGERMRAREGQLHSFHLEVKGEFLAAVERGEQPVPRTAARYLRRHVREHEQMRHSERPTEQVRDSRPRLRRVNPLDFFQDPTADDRDECSWVACRYLVRRADVLADERYDRAAREQLRTAQDRWEGRTSHEPSRRGGPGSFDVPDDMVVVYEAFDLVDQQRRVWADHAELMLLPGEDRMELATLQPSGPFHLLVFVEDVMEAQGVPPPCAFEAEQAALTAIATSNVQAAVESRPKMLYNAREIDPDEMQRVLDARAGSAVGVNPKGSPDKDLAKSFTSSPTFLIDPQSLAVAALATRGIERRSGLGTAKLGGGEAAPTATGAALGAEASTSVSDDRAATVDEWAEGTARGFVRLSRRYASPVQVARVCGEAALEVWPARWALEDAADDTAVTVVPGSARRQNTSVDQKQLLDGLGVLAADPVLVGPAAAALRCEVYRRFFEDAGVSGLDWEGVSQEAVLVSGGGAQGEPPPVPGPTATRPDDVVQGVANVGGGRVPTGAGIGDKVRLVRGQARRGAVDRGQ